MTDWQKLYPLTLLPVEQAAANLDRLYARCDFGIACAPLSPAQRAIVRHMVRNRTTAEIATARGTAYATIRNQITIIYQRMDVRSRIELIRVLAGAPSVHREPHLAVLCAALLASQEAA